MTIHYPKDEHLRKIDSEFDLELAIIKLQSKNIQNQSARSVP